MTYQIEILTREALDSHLEELCLIDSHTLGERWEARHFTLDLPEKWACSRLVLDGQSRIAAFIVASFKGDDAHVHRLVVKESHRGQGIGTRLIREVAEFAERLSIARLTLKVARDNSRAIEFYHRLGFSQINANAENLELSVPVSAFLTRMRLGSKLNGIQRKG